MPEDVLAHASVQPDRLRSSRDVRHVLGEGSRRARPRLALHWVQTPGQRRPRLAVVASRRVGSAPERNRAKRLLREAGACIDWPEDVDVVLVARPAIRGARLWDVLDDLVALTGRTA